MKWPARRIQKSEIQKSFRHYLELATVDCGTRDKDQIAEKLIEQAAHDSGRRVVETVSTEEIVGMMRCLLQLVASLGKLYCVPLDADNPEDYRTLLHFAVVGWLLDDAGRAGITLTEEAVKQYVNKILRAIGKKLGIKISPFESGSGTAVGTGMGYYLNYYSTKGVGTIAQIYFRERRLDQLKEKYQSVLDFIRTRGLVHPHVGYQNDNLFIQGVCPSQDIKNEIWDQIKLVDPAYGDLTCDLSIDSASAGPLLPPTTLFDAIGRDLQTIFGTREK